jgi:hypothetical protein
MSEIVNDLKLSTLEISSPLGLNLSGDNARIKHTGSSGLTIEPHHNPDVPASVVTAQFGNAGTTDAFNVAAAATNAKIDVRYDWRLGPNLAQVSVVVDLVGIVNGATDNDFVGYTAGAAAVLLSLPTNTRVLNISARVTETSNIATDVYSLYVDDINTTLEDAAATGTLVLDNITANSAGTAPVYVASSVATLPTDLTHRHFYLACQDTSAAADAARTSGKIVITMVLCVQA